MANKRLKAVQFHLKDLRDERARAIAEADRKALEEKNKAFKVVLSNKEKLRIGGEIAEQTKIEKPSDKEEELKKQ